MSPSLYEIKERYERVLAKIQSLCPSQKAGGVRLIAVSKKQAVEKIHFLSKLGHKDFGENYYQEMVEKSEALEQLGCNSINWVFIGQLQSNKIKRIVEVACEIQSVSSLKHVRYVDRSALECGKKAYPIYLLINAGGEASKAGFSWEELEEVREKIKNNMPNLALQGIMAIPPKLDLQNNSIEFYEKLYRRIAEQAQKTGAGKLSLGMSSDLELALKVGSDCVRVGTDIFGKRE